MGHDSCRWVRKRLPLLAGEDLVGPDRRRTERHLVQCRHCRGELTALKGVLGVLRRAAQEPVLAVEQGSLWPSLTRQMQEQRHGLGTPGRWSRTILVWSGAGLAAACLLLALGLLGLWRQPGNQRGSATVAQAKQRGPARKVRTLSVIRPSLDRRSTLADYDPRRDPLIQAGPRASNDLPRTSAMGVSH